MKKTIAFLLLIIPACLLPLLFESCRQPDTYEMIGQELSILNDGKYDEVLIAIHFSVNRIAQTHTSSPLIQSAYAFSALPPEFNNRIVNMEIFLDKDFDVEHPFDTNLFDLFSLYNDFDPLIPSITLPAKPRELFSLYLRLNVAPTEDIQAQITIKTYTDNGEVFSATAFPLSINP